MFVESSDEMQNRVFERIELEKIVIGKNSNFGNTCFVVSVTHYP